MELSVILSGFMKKIAEDSRIGPTHISLYLAILHFYEQQDLRSPISIYSRELMRQAKISNRTYHTCMADLRDGGYIKYIPSYNPVLGSLIYIL